MSSILALLTAIILISSGVMRRKHRRRTVSPVLVRRYVHPGHAWLRLTEDGEVIVGVDDFAQSLVGTVDEVALPRLLKSLSQGQVAMHLWHGHRCVPIVSPVSGRVIEKNEMVLHDPSLVNSSPYGDGWLLRVHPAKIENQLRNLLAGKWVHVWQEMAMNQLRRYYSGTPALMYQDGGVLLKNLSDRCSDDEWKAMVKEFFLLEETASKR